MTEQPIVVVSVRQVDGVTRLMALTLQDRNIYAATPPMIDHLDPLAVADLYPDGTLDWVRRSADRPDAIDAIRRWRRSHWEPSPWECT